MTEHSPKPWRLEGGSFGEPIIRDANYEEIAEVFEDGVPSKANARLIAAAPQMLEALERACEVISPHAEATHRMVFEAIAAAKGTGD